MILDFGSFTRRGFLADLERPEEIWGGGGKARVETVEGKKTTDLPPMRETDT